jgi:hypothetical protein
MRIDVTTSIDQREAVEPLVIVRIDWPSGTKWYADKDLVLSGITMAGRILSFSDISSQRQINSIGEIASASIVLDDTDSILKTIIKKDIIEGSSCTVYQYFEGDTFDDLLLLMRGRLMSQIVWSEGERTLSFSIETYIKDSLVGYAAKDGDFDDLNPDIIGVPWPILFGNPVKTPTVQAVRRINGTLTYELKSNFVDIWEANTAYTNGDIRCSDSLSPRDYYFECTTSGTSGSTEPSWDLTPGNTTNDGTAVWTTRESGTVISNDNYSFTWDGIEDFPQNEVIEIDIVPIPDNKNQIDNRYFGFCYSNFNNTRIRYRGKIINDTFYVTSTVDPPYPDKNIPLYTNLAFANRPSRYDDPDTELADTVWLADETAWIKGLICTRSWDGSGDPNTMFYNRCIEQEGNKCKFEMPWRRSVSAADNQAARVYLDSANEPISEAVEVGRQAWGTEYIVRRSLPIVTYFNDTYRLLEGSVVRLITDTPDVYVANIVTGGTIEAVYGEKVVDGVNKLIELDESAEYEIDTDYTFAGALANVPNVVAIKINVPLTLRTDGDWTGNVFVTMTSSEGPNVAEVIKYLIDTYTDLYIDTDSYNQAVIDTDGFPVDFAILDQKKILTILEEISWQARCALAVRNGKFILRYLSKLPDETYNLNSDNIDVKSVGLGFTITEDIITHLIANWKTDYSGDADSDKIFKYENNVSLYGVIEESKDFYIYKSESLVEMSAAFWGYRYSNSWRKLNCRSYLNALRLEIFDVCSLDLDVLSLNQLKGEIESLSYNSAEFYVDMEIEVASETGYIDSINEPELDENYWLGDPNYPITAIEESDTVYAKAIQVVLAISPRSYLSGEGAYTGPYLWREETKNLWNNHHATFMNYYETLVTDEDTPEISKAIIFIPNGPFHPYPGLGYAFFNKDFDVLSVVGKSTELGKANYEEVLAYTLDEDATLEDYLAAYKHEGGDEGDITVNVDIFLDITNDPTRDWIPHPPQGYTDFKNQLTAWGISVTVHQYEGQKWLDEINDFLSGL